MTHCWHDRLEVIEYRETITTMWFGTACDGPGDEPGNALRYEVKCFDCEFEGEWDALLLPKWIGERIQTWGLDYDKDS